MYSQSLIIVGYNLSQGCEGDCPLILLIIYGCLQNKHIINKNTKTIALLKLPGSNGNELCRCSQKSQAKRTRGC